MTKIIVLISFIAVVGMAAYQAPAKYSPAPEPTPDPYTVLPTF